MLRKKIKKMSHSKNAHNYRRLKIIEKKFIIIHGMMIALTKINNHGDKN